MWCELQGELESVRAEIADFRPAVRCAKGKGWVTYCMNGSSIVTYTFDVVKAKILCLKEDGNI